MQKWGFSTILATLALVGLGAGAGCIPSTRNSMSLRAPTTSSPSIFNSPSNQNLTASQQVCVHYDDATPFKSYCEACVDEVLSLYCPGQDEPTGCSSSIQSTFNTRVNQCISNTLTLGFACARTCGAGTVLDNTCSCVVPAPPTFNGQGVLPTQDYGLLNVGAPTSVAVFRNNLGTSSTPQACSLSLNLDLTVTNRSLTQPRTNTYEFDFAHISRGLNPSYITQASQLVSYEDPIRNINARAAISLATTRSATDTAVDSLGRVERYSGKPFQSDTTGTGITGTLTASAALWSQYMGQIVSTKNLAAPVLYVADIANNRVRSINTATSAVSDVMINTAARIKTVMPYGLASYESGGSTNLFVSQWGYNGGGANSNVSPNTGSLVVHCNAAHGFCGPNRCYEEAISTRYTQRGQGDIAICPPNEDGTGSHRVLLHQIPVVAGMDYVAGPARLFLVLPHEKQLWVPTPDDLNPVSATGAWYGASYSITANRNSISLTGGSSAAFTNGTAVTVYGQDTGGFCSITESWWDDLARELRRETLYYIVNKSGSFLQLAASPNGAPISFSTSIDIDGSGGSSCNNDPSGNITLVKADLAAVPKVDLPTGLTLPSDVKVDAGSNFVYVSDAGSGRLWRSAIDGTTRLPTGSWTAINSLPTEGTVPSDSATGAVGSISIQLVNPIGLAISENSGLPDDLIIVEGRNPDPYNQPGGGVVRIYCANDDLVGSLPVSAPCKGKAIGIYRLAGSFQGHVSESPDMAPIDTTFSSPISLAIATPTSAAGQLTHETPAFLVSDSTDAGIFRLSPQTESGLLGLKYRISDVYNQTANQCLRFQMANSCSGWGSPSSVTFTDAGDLVTLSNHGMRNGDRVMLTSIASTTGIAVNTEYYVINSNTNNFQIAATSGGAALPLTTNGSGTLLSVSCSCRAIPMSHADVPLWQAVGSNETCETFTYP